jgi:hypothetical protein
MFAPAQERFPGLRLRSHIADLVFTARLRDRDAIVIFVIEHKSAPDHNLHPQVLRYVVHLRHVMRRRDKADTLLIVPIVLYHGTEPLVLHPPCLPNLDPETAAAFAAHEPRLELLIDNLGHRSEAELRRGDYSALAQLTHLCLAIVPRLTNQEVLAAIDRWGALLAAVEADPGPPLAEDALDAIGWYLLDTTDVSEEQLQMAFANNLNQPQGSRMTTGQKLRLEGRMQGRAEGPANSLIRMLTRRFGPMPADLTQRVQTATQAEFDFWFDRILDAKTVADVFTAGS